MLVLVGMPAFAQTADHEHRPTAAAGPANPAPQPGAPGMALGIGGTPMTVINNTFNPTGPTGTGTFNPTAEFIVRVNDGCGIQRSMSSATARHVEGRMILLHAFIKKTQKTPAGERDLAAGRMKEIT
jgi:phage-related protein